MGTSVVLAYVWAAVALVVFFLFAALFSSMVPYKPGDTGAGKCKAIFWICCVLNAVIGFVINFVVANGINIPSAHDRYMTASGIAAGAALVLFIIIGVVVAKAASRSKLARWF